MSQIFVRPASGYKVRNPDTGFSHLPAGGDTVMPSPYWTRKIKEGAVLVGPPEAPKPKAAPAPAPAIKQAAKKDD